MTRVPAVLGVLLAGALIAVLIPPTVGSGVSGAPPTTRASFASAPRDTPTAGRSPGPASETRTGAGESNITFEESGLPSLTAWQVLVSRSGTLFATDAVGNGSTISEPLAAGQYNVSAAADRSDYQTWGAPASINVSGNSTAISLQFDLGYLVTFAEDGLPFNVTWNVSITASGHSENRTVAGNSTEIWVPAGAYRYSDTSDGYVPSVSNGTGTLSGASVVHVEFSRPRPPVGFLRVQLDVPSADVYLNGVLYSGLGRGTTQFNLTPGVWSVFVHAAGYGDYFNATRLGDNQTVTMVVNLVPTPSNPGPALLSSTADVIIAGLAIGLAVIGLLFVVAWGRLSRR